MLAPVRARPESVSTTSIAIAFTLLGLAADGCSNASVDSGGVRRDIDFATVIAPIVRAHCTGCHRRGGVAPFPFERHVDLADRAVQIANVVERGYMPPWLPRQGEGAAPLAYSRALDTRERETLLAWIAQGQGPSWYEAAGTSALDTGAGEVGAGEGTLMLECTAPLAIPAEGSGLTRTLVFPCENPEPLLVRGVHLSAAPASAIKSVSFLADATRVARRMDAEDPAPGYLSMGDIGYGISGALGSIAAGSAPRLLPPGYAFPLAAHSDIVAQVHLRTTGAAYDMTSCVQVHLAEEPVTRMVQPLALGSLCIDIPPGEPNYMVEDTLTLPCEVEILGVLPRAHYVCQEIEFTSLIAGQSALTLLRIPDWNADFQEMYYFSEPRLLPAGARLRFVARFDNSVANRQNPYSPPRRIVRGPRAENEVAWLVLLVSATDPSHRSTIERLHAEECQRRIRDHRAWAGERR